MRIPADPGIASCLPAPPRRGSEVLGSPDCWASSIMIVTEIEVHEFHPEYLEWLHHALFHYYGETTRTVFVVSLLPCPPPQCLSNHPT